VVVEESIGSSSSSSSSSSSGSSSGGGVAALVIVTRIRLDLSFFTTYPSNGTPIKIDNSRIVVPIPPS